MTNIIVVQGGQYGSEGKGNIAAYLANREHAEYAVRTGSINAGHTVYYGDKAYRMQQLPTAWASTQYTKLVLGPGAYVSLPTLERELGWIMEARGLTPREIRKLVLVDYRCGLHAPEDEAAAKEAGRHLLIGATGKGCAESIIRKIKDRGKGYSLVGDLDLQDMPVQICDTVEVLNKSYDAGETILIEGTQGSELDLHLGPYPYTTSRMTSAANWVAEAGLSPALMYDVYLVFRAFPIRVAGDSGPMPRETNWVDFLYYKMDHGLAIGAERDDVEYLRQAIFLAASQFQVPKTIDAVHQELWHREMFKEALSEINARALIHLQTVHPDSWARLSPHIEFTTVTKKPRRIAWFDAEVAKKVIKRERPSHLVLTFADYLEPSAVLPIEKSIGWRFGLVSTGPRVEDVAPR